MAINAGAKTVLLVALVTVLLTYAALQSKSSNGETVSHQGRKSLSDPQLTEITPVLGEDAVTETETEDVTDETVEGDAVTPPIANSEESSEEVSDKSSEEVSEESSEEVSEESSEEGSEEVTEEPVVEETEEATNTDESYSSGGNAEDVQTEENVDFSAEAQEDSEEVSREEKPVREMEETALPPPDPSLTAANSTIIENPDKDNFPKPLLDDPSFLFLDFAADNSEGKKNEPGIQNCIHEDGCGTP